LALLVSLALHGLVALAVCQLPGRTGGAHPTGPGAPLGLADGPDEESIPALCVLRRRPPPRRAPDPVPVLRPAAVRLVVPPPKPKETDTRLGRNAAPTAEALPPKPGGESPPLFASLDPRPPSGKGEDEGAPGGVTFFQVETRARSVVYVIDRSMSMALQGRLSAARRELLASLSRLAPSTLFQVVVYNRQAEALRIAGQTRLVPATDENKGRAALFLREVLPEGATDHLPALTLALTFQPDAVFFLTDADDLTDRQVQTVTRINREQNRGRTCIHAIELTPDNRGREDMPLHRLARDNHGSYCGVELSTAP
jgi:hypothetical protein